MKEIIRLNEEQLRKMVNEVLDNNQTQLKENYGNHGYQ